MDRVDGFEPTTSNSWGVVRLLIRARVSILAVHTMQEQYTMIYAANRKVSDILC